MSRKAALLRLKRPGVTPSACYIETHFAEPLSVASLAAIAGFSPFHFARLFASQVGESPMGYVRRRTSAISWRISSGVSRTMPIWPKPPALLTAAASSERAGPPIPAQMMG